ncbi:hypothetical protein I302_100226 [Kwoniella bestiolae CBS 10118]|uniref:N-acetyltransferase domain-containing protein n=1 Tax=Kwoniella bestiolae CBS 10118 TaxID=1296100 RepID=A0A1B9G4G6_9TREE|nr:hypothetical protein I302_03600 [Kwoniella bestiolae CBS 10118]OCF25924.1 hypothetical protein I302_03600 [Kwoniella bestiolae CBS 10118]
MSLGPRFDCNVHQQLAAAGESMERVPLAGELWALRDTNPGRIISVMNFRDSTKTYRAGEWTEFYDDTAEEEFLKEKVEWQNDVLSHNANEMVMNAKTQLGVHSKNAFFLTYMVTHQDYRSKGYGTRLLSKLTSFSRRENCPFVLFTSGDRAVSFYQKSGFTLFDERELPALDGTSIPLTLMTYLPEGWSKSARPEHT